MCQKLKKGKDQTNVSLTIEGLDLGLFCTLSNALFLRLKIEGFEALDFGLSCTLLNGTFLLSIKGVLLLLLGCELNSLNLKGSGVLIGSGVAAIMSGEGSRQERRVLGRVVSVLSGVSSL